MSEDETEILINGDKSPVPVTTKDTPAKNSCLRWLALIFMAILLFAPAYTESNLISLDEQLSAQPFSLTSREYGLLFTTYQATATFFPLIGGFIADYIGVRKSLLLFTCLFTIGQISFFWGLYTTDYYFLVLGRFFLCSMLGAVVTIYKAIGYMFKFSEVSFAMAFAMAVSRVAIPAESFITPLIYDNSGLVWAPAILGLSLCFIAILCSFIIGIIQWRIKKGRREEASERRNREFAFNETMKFGKLFWGLAMTLALGFTSLMCFYNQASDFTLRRFGIDYETIKYIIAVIPFMFSVAAPIAGLSTDSIGKKPIFIALGMFVMMVSHLVLMLLPNYEDSYVGIAPYLLMGIGAGIFGAAIWPSIAIVVDQKLLGTAFGFAYMLWQVLQEIILAVGDVVIASTSHNKFGYFYFEVLMMSLTIAGLITSFYVYVLDRKYYKGVLTSIGSGPQKQTPDSKKPKKKM